MPEKRRNFWIMLTVIAIVFSTARWLESRSNRNHHRNDIYKECKKRKKKHRTTCNVERYRPYKKNCQVKDSYRTPAIDDFVFVHKEPVALNYNEILGKVEYPQIARDAGIEGTVLVRVLVDEHGNYQKHKIISQAHAMLGRNCDRVVGDLKFTPAVRDGQPVKFWVNIPFHFEK